MRFIKGLISAVIIFTIIAAGNCAFAFESVCAFSDFESGLDGWNNDFESTMYRTNEQAHSGRFSMETTVMNNYGCPKYHFRFIPGVKYRFSVWVKTKDKADVAQVIFDYSAYGQQQPYWSFFCMNTPVSPDKWTQIAFDYVYSGGNPTGDTNIFVRIGDGRVAELADEERMTYYIDDMKISYQNPNYSYAPTVYSHAESAVNMGFDNNLDGYFTKDARMKYVKDGCKNTYGAALVMTEAKGGYVGQRYTVEDGKRYELSAYVKSTGARQPFTYMVAEKVNGSYISRPLSDTVYVGDEWTRLSAEYKIGDGFGGREKIFYVLAGSGSGQTKYYLDEFSILKFDSDESSAYTVDDVHFDNADGKLSIMNSKGSIISNSDMYFENGELICRADTIAKAIGAEYNEDGGAAAFIKGTDTLKITEGSQQAYFNNIVKASRIAPLYKNGRLNVSADFVCGAFGIETKYIQDKNIYYIKNAAASSALSGAVRKINSGMPLRLVYFASGFTRGADTDYPVVKPIKDRLYNWFSESFPGSKINLTDAQLNGTDSGLGIYRLENDVLKAMPDVVFIDFSVQDFVNASPEKSAYNIENIIRRIKENKPDTDIVLINSISSEMLSVYESAELPYLSKTYRNLAEYYDCGYCDAAEAVYNDYKQSGLGSEEYFIKNMQYTERAVSVSFEALSQRLDEYIKNCDNTFVFSMKKPIFRQSVNYSMTDFNSIAVGDGWSTIQSADGKERLFSDKAGSVLKVLFTGKAIGIMYETGPKSGALEYKIDDGDWKYFDLYDDISYKYERTAYKILCDDLENTQHTLTVRNAEKCSLKSMGRETLIDGFLEKR